MLEVRCSLHSAPWPLACTLCVWQHSTVISIDFYSLSLSSSPVSRHASLSACLCANSCNLASGATPMA